MVSVTDSHARFTMLATNLDLQARSQINSFFPLLIFSKASSFYIRHHVLSSDERYT